MFKKYYLVELFGTNGTKSARSNTVLTTRGMFPPLEMAYQNMIDSGFVSVNVLSVARISKKTADYIKNHMNSRERYDNKAVGELVRQVENSMNSMKTADNTDAVNPKV